MKLLFFVFTFVAPIAFGQLTVSNRNCIWPDSSVLYRGMDNELDLVSELSFDSISSSFGELNLSNIPDRIIYRTISGTTSKHDMLRFFSNELEIAHQFVQLKNPGKDTLTWWNHNGTITRSQLQLNKAFGLTSKNGNTRFYHIIGFTCRYQKPDSVIQYFPICDSTFNQETNAYEWIGEEYEMFGGNLFPDCILLLFETLPTGTILYFQQFKTICPDCLARNNSWQFQVELVD